MDNFYIQLQKVSEDDGIVYAYHVSETRFNQIKAFLSLNTDPECDGATVPLLPAWHNITEHPEDMPPEDDTQYLVWDSATKKYRLFCGWAMNKLHPDDAVYKWCEIPPMWNEV